MHYKFTSEEINKSMDGKIDYVFVGTGICGALSGISKKLKELNSTIKVIGVDPIGS